jgi:arabinosaccharide transport system substrate-binding protein
MQNDPTTNRMKTRCVFEVLLCAVLLAALPSCSRQAEQAPDGTQIVYWTFGEEDGDIRVMRECFEALNLTNATLVVKQYGFEELHDKLLAVFAGGGQGAPDICDVEISQVGRFYKQEPIGFMDLTDRIRNSPYYEDQIKARLTPYTYKGRLYGIDGNLSLSMVYYRRDLFEAHGITTPLETWDDFIRAGLKLKDSGIFMLQVPNGANPENYNEDFVPQLLIQQGGGYFDEAGDVIVNNAAGIRTITLINDMVNKHGIAQATSTDIFDPPFYGPYLSGKVAAMIMPSWMLYFFMEPNMPDMSGKWGIMPLPAWEPGGRRTSTAGGGALMIPRHTKHPEIAWKLFEFKSMRKAGGMISNRIMGHFPPIKSVMQDPEIVRPEPYLGGQSMGAFFQEYADQIPAYHLSPYWWDAHLFMASEVLYPVLMEGLDPEKALNNMATRLEQAMQR